VVRLLVYATALEAVRKAHPILARLRRLDRNLSEQALRAASSIVLNIAEAEYSDGGNRRARLHTAAGSANELAAALDLAVVFEHISLVDAEPILDHLDRVRAMLYRLGRR
jgi:four helix bundle protein